MKKVDPKTEKALRNALGEQEVSGADADHSEQPASLFSNLNSDDAEGYDPTQDQTPELDKKRIGDK